MAMALMLAAGVMTGALGTAALQRLSAWRAARRQEWDPY
jgi:hypothetical protein